MPLPGGDGWRTAAASAASFSLYSKHGSWYTAAVFSRARLTVTRSPTVANHTKQAQCVRIHLAQAPNIISVT